MDSKEVVRAFRRGETVKPEDVPPETQERFSKALWLRKYGLSPYNAVNRKDRRAKAAQMRGKK